MSWLDLVAIDAQVLGLCPGYTALIIVAEGLRPGPSEAVKHLLPVGGEDLDMYRGPARLARAAGDEPFDTTKDGEPAEEHPEPGEVIWRDDIGVTCRRWNWRQCTRTRITGSTVNGVFILDGLAVPGQDRLGMAGHDLAEQLAALNPGASLTSRLLGSQGRQ